MATVRRRALVGSLRDERTPIGLMIGMIPSWIISMMIGMIKMMMITHMKRMVSKKKRY